MVPVPRPAFSTGRFAAVAAGITVMIAGAALGLTAIAKPRPAQSDAVARGKYLVSIMGCNDCHTPWKPGPNGPEPDMTRFLSGHPEQVTINATPGAMPEPWMWAGAGSNTAYAGPWGVSFAANLTPDQNTGLGIWTEDMFVRAIKTGRHFGTSRPIMPPMPWPAYKNATEDDLKAVFAYLRTIKPITNHVPDYMPAKSGQ